MVWSQTGTGSDLKSIGTIVISADEQKLLEQSWNALQKSVYAALAVQTRLKSYLDSVDLVVTDQGIKFNTSALQAMLEQKKQSDAANAIIDLAELYRYANQTLVSIGFDQSVIETLYRYTTWHELNYVEP